uniref:Uncharacterized protein n=1 Tax=Glossina palpalis gambiensis TaxID=67801 RepID=A0A1B0C463_9MUSC
MFKGFLYFNVIVTEQLIEAEYTKGHISHILTPLPSKPYDKLWQNAMSKRPLVNSYHYKCVEFSDLPQIFINWYLESALNPPMVDVSVMTDEIKQCPDAAKAKTT